MKTTIIVIISLLVGFGVGSVVTKKAPEVSTNLNGMTHQMPDGSTMSNSMMKDSMDAMMTGLQGKTGDEFDKAFLSEMIMHHEGAVDMAEAALRDAKHQEIKDLASAIITAQTKEIGMMKGWQTQWYK